MMKEEERQKDENTHKAKGEAPQTGAAED